MGYVEYVGYASVFNRVRVCKRVNNTRGRVGYRVRMASHALPVGRVSLDMISETLLDRWVDGYSVFKRYPGTGIYPTQRNLGIFPLVNQYFIHVEF